MVCYLGDTDEVVFATVLSPLPGETVPTVPAATATSTSTTTTTEPEPDNIFVLGVGPAGSDQGDGATVAEHVGQVLWNQSADNITQSSGTSGHWISSYREESELPEGQVVLDIDAGTISGEMVEHWTCAGQCLDRWPYVDTDWTATIDGRLEPAGAGWTLTGTVQISYTLHAGTEEQPSNCNGTPCYHCEERFCRFEGSATGTASLEGSVEGTTVSLSFADGLDAVFAPEDYQSMRFTEFFESRLVHTWSLGEPVPPPGG